MNFGDAFVLDELHAALCHAFSFNHIRQMAPIVDADAKSLLTARLRAGLANVWLFHASSLLLLITGPPNGPVLFCWLASVDVVCNVVGVRAGGWARRNRAADTAWRASTVTSR